MNIFNLLARHPRRTAFVVSFVFFFLYATTTPTVNVGYADSDEFLSVAYSGGIAHPPGYPLYVSVLHVAMNLPLPGTTPAQRAHLVSGASATIALYFMTLTLFTLAVSVTLKKRDHWIRPVSIVATVATVATAKLFWLYAQLTEKYIFSAPFVAAIMYLAVTLKHAKTGIHTTIFRMLFIYGLLLSHHQSMVFLLPYIIYTLYPFFFRDSLKRVAVALAALVAGLILPLSLILLTAAHPPSVSWATEPGLKGLLDMVTRADFRGEIYAQKVNSNGYVGTLSINQLLSGASHYLLTVVSTFSWWVILPITLAVLALWNHKRRQLVELSLPFLLTGVALGAYLGWPEDLGSQAATTRFYIPGIITLAPILFYGIVELIRRLSASFDIVGITTAVKIGVLSIFILSTPLLHTILSYRAVSLRSFDLISSLYSSVLDGVEADSIVTCYSDSACFALLYEQTVNGRRSDVDIVPLAYPLVSRSLPAKKLNHFTYETNPFLMLDIVTWNLDKRPVYAVDISQYYFELYGIDYGFMNYIPAGYAGKLTRSVPTDIPFHEATISERYAKLPVPEFDLMRRFLVQSLTQTHFSNAYIWLKIGDRESARRELDRGVNLAYSMTDTEKKSAQETRNQIERTSPDVKHSPGSHVVSSKVLLSHLPDLFKANKNSQAYKVALGAVTVDPDNIDARLELARIFSKMQDRNFTRMEYQNVLILDPLNQEAKNELAKLSL